MIKPETARQLKEAGLKPGEDFGEELFTWLPDVETMVREIYTRGWRLMVMIYPKECHLKVYDANYNSAEMTGPAEDFADLVGRALLFVLNAERGKKR